MSFKGTTIISCKNVTNNFFRFSGEKINTVRKKKTIPRLTIIPVCLSIKI